MPAYLAFLSGLANYGPIGIILLMFLLLFWKAFNRMFDNLLRQQASFEVFMGKSLAELEAIRVNCIQCSNCMQQVTHEVERLMEERIGQKLDAMKKEILDALGKSAKEIVQANQRDNDLSRPHSVTPSPVRQPYPLASGAVVKG